MTLWLSDNRLFPAGRGQGQSTERAYSPSIGVPSSAHNGDPSRTLRGSASIRPAAAQGGRPLTGLVELGLKFLVDGLKGHDGSDAGSRAQCADRPSRAQAANRARG
jgi:hypothetical protein